ncbi:MAG TPA: L,D-transpeptidase [Candidatus Dormibacteraeota bacterium]|nr:L,D-transpeptidase [Candidatus Dormibacteraeota bacterium]
METRRRPNAPRTRRRANRLLPAIALVLVGACLLAGWLWHPWRSADHAAIDRLSAQTDAAWRDSLTRARSGATAELTAAAALAHDQARWLPPQFGAGIDPWRQRLASAATPAAYDSLARDIHAATDAARGQADARRAAAVPSSPPALLAAARGLLARAGAAHLDPGPVAGLTGRLDQAVSAGGDQAGPAAQLTGALPDLQTLVGINDDLAVRMRPLLSAVGRARAERTPGANAEWSRYQALQGAFSAARAIDQMTAVQSETGSLEQAVAADLSANRCGHPVPAGHVIALDLTAQEIVFYDNGCAVRAAPVTTGRPALPTPTGTFSLFAKFSPYVFHSPWPPGSPYWYPTSPVGYAMEFAQGGYFLHDAPWEPDSQYGPGSQNGSGASHGCVHIPAPDMAWAYGWASLGTPVIITA